MIQWVPKEVMFDEPPRANVGGRCTAVPVVRLDALTGVVEGLRAAESAGLGYSLEASEAYHQALTDLLAQIEGGVK